MKLPGQVLGSPETVGTGGFGEQRRCLKSWRTVLIVGGMGSHKLQKHMLPPGCLKWAADNWLLQLSEPEMHVQLGGVADSFSVFLFEVLMKEDYKFFRLQNWNCPLDSS